MLGQFLVGSAASVCNIAIHALVTAVVVWVANAMGGKSTSWPFLLLICTMIATVLVSRPDRNMRKRDKLKPAGQSHVWIFINELALLRLVLGSC
jgi:hypothetical protein